MNQLTRTRSPEVIATEINWIKKLTRDVLLHSSVEIGRRLVEVKELLPHGEWMDWLRDNVNYSQTTANNLMALYREYGDKSHALGNLSYTQALALLGVPADEREQFAQEHDAENKSSRELQKLVRQKQLLEEQLKDAQAKAERQLVAAQELAADVARLKTELADAKIAGNETKAQQLQEELATSQARIQELEAELKSRPIDVAGVVEKIPEAVEAELAELRSKSAQGATPATIKFRVYFDNLVKGFQDLLVTLGEVQQTDPALHVKYKGAVSSLIGKMSERL
ncbi:DUF3102 domain-containing protein [Alicyclobacillus tolerans]|uniref:DUF3102 domain-containing protein n=1 Tax=Alicyclobacillus tolerans TaxID=90970 RepID=UPI001F176669|nr:DUF3102 domain-containing protein [Alicyclobacillus tolerans]MCF8566882.1 DUF3102 domain-containing protein [Alicyclobacillus tolerans]